MKAHYFLLVLVLLGCENESFESGDLSDPVDMEEALLIAPPPTSQALEEHNTITKKVIKIGGIDFLSTDIVNDYNKIRSLLPRFDAYIENENQSKSKHRINYVLTIRVPSEVYDTLYSSFTTLSENIENRYSRVEDVTERYYDLETRIKNNKTLEQRYLKLLNKAVNIKDILEIERNLNEIRTDIERFEGQLHYLKKRVRFSTINLSFYEILPYTYDSSERKGFGARVLTALNNGWQGLLSVIIGLSSMWPFVVTAALGIYLFHKIRRKVKKKTDTDRE